MTGVVLGAVSLLFAVFGRLDLFFCLFAALAVHEAGHVLGARLIGKGSVKLSFCAFSAAMRVSEPLEPSSELFIAAAGPAAGMLSALAVSGLISFSGFFDALFPFVSFSIALTIVNLLPAMPLDGGRILRASVILLAGKKAGKAVSRAFSLLSALVISTFGAYSMAQGEINLSAFIMVFIIFVSLLKSGNESAVHAASSLLFEQTRMKNKRSTAARTVAIRQDCTVESALLLSDGFELIAVVDSDMRLKGSLSRGDLLCAAVADKNKMEIRKLI